MGSNTSCMSDNRLCCNSKDQQENKRRPSYQKASPSDILYTFENDEEEKNVFDLRSKYGEINFANLHLEPNDSDVELPGAPEQRINLEKAKLMAQETFKQITSHKYEKYNLGIDTPSFNFPPQQSSEETPPTKAKKKEVFWAIKQEPVSPGLGSRDKYTYSFKQASENVVPIPSEHRSSLIIEEMDSVEAERQNPFLRIKSKFTTILI